MEPRKSIYHRHRFPPDIIRHAVWLYFRFCLSYRDVEDLLAERGINVSYETVRRWSIRFGPLYANRLRKRSGPGGDRWFVTDKLRSYAAAHREVMPDTLHDTSQYANNRAELSCEPTRQRERTMRGSVASEFIGDKPPRRSALLLEKPTKEPGRGCLVSPFLDQDIQDLPILINGPKQITLLSVDANKDFIDKPLIAAWVRSLT